MNSNAAGHMVTDLIVVTFKIDRDFLREIDSIARIEGITRSELIRRALREYLKKYEARRPYKVVRLRT